MKGLRLYIAPFAPDQSGAAAVFCEMGGMVIILDAGGCAGNICGFDEPRWFGSRSAIFSAGLRDMDAILGRDDLLVGKVEKACKDIEAAFVAVIGTPVPAVIGTDYRALARMIEKRADLPAVTVDTNGMALYDEGASKAWLALMKKFAGSRPEEARPENRLEDDEPANKPEEDMPQKRPGENIPAQKSGFTGILGMTPLDFGPDFSMEKAAGLYQEETKGHAVIFGAGKGLDSFLRAADMKENLVVSPSGFAAARYLEKKYGIPWRADCLPDLIPGFEEAAAAAGKLSGRRILILHQQVLANAARERLEKLTDAAIDTASWFMMDKELARPGDIRIREEDDWISLVRGGDYDLIMADPLMRRPVADYKGIWIDSPHFAVSGKYI